MRTVSRCKAGSQSLRQVRKRKPLGFHVLQSVRRKDRLMDLRFEHECPQCGAPIALTESERFLECPYCGIRNYLSSPYRFHLTFPHKAQGKDWIYAPYMRFKGNIFYCQDLKTEFRFVDHTQLAAPLNGVPRSLGFRPQAMTLKFLDPAARGSFLKPSLPETELLNKVSRLGQNSSGRQFHHRTFIGETTSLIYLPLYVYQNKLYDGITDQPVTPLASGMKLNPTTIEDKPSWRLNVLATICPGCGWNLEGEKDSVVLLCRHCSTTWEASQGRLALIDHVVVPDIGRDLTYLPFWKMTVSTSGLPLKSFADFLKIARQPRAVFDDWEDTPMNFWSPAFKIRPKLFLDLLRNTTIAQPSYSQSEVLARKQLFPVTLPSSEAAQTFKLTLAAASMKKNDVFPLLPRVRFKVEQLTLVYLAFMDNGHEMVQPCSQLTINKNALNFGRYL